LPARPHGDGDRRQRGVDQLSAVELAREIFGSLSNKKVMLIGAGKMSELAARHLYRSGVSQILVSNRTRSRAEEWPSWFAGKIVDYEKALHNAS